MRESWTNIRAFQNGLAVQEVIFSSQKKHNIRLFATHDKNGMAMPHYTYTRPSISRQGLTFHFGHIPDFWLQLISVLVAEVILLDTYQVLADD